MKKRIVTLALALTMVMVLTAALTACREEGESATDLPTHPIESNSAPPTHQVDPVEVTPSPTPEPPGPAAGVTLNTAEHIVYIMGNGAGYFNPGSNITRAETAVIFCRLLPETVPVTVSYTDVPESSWYAEAAGQMGSLGVLRPDESTFNGDEAISRGEFVNCIAAFFPPRADEEQFSDVMPDDPYADAILSCKAYGWLNGYTDGTFHGEQPILRCEAVTILNRALDRTGGDRTSIEENRPALFLDVPVNVWYYDDVMEATVPHTFTADEAGAETWTSFEQADTGLPEDFRTQGFHLYQGWSYYYSEDVGDISRSTSVSGGTFDADGHFTTGDPWMDEQLREIVLSQTSSDMTGEEMLQAFFAYCRDTYKYLKWNHYAAGATGFTMEAARQMLSTGRGNCYCYASVFWYLARWIGYDARIISGYMYSGDHCWVEIDGYIYDTQLEWRYVHDWGRTWYLWHFYHLVDSANEINYRR